MLGRSTVILHDHEMELAHQLKTEKLGFGLTRKEVVIIVSEFVEDNGLETLFKNNIPGEDCFLSSTKRHPLSLKKKTQFVEIARKMRVTHFSFMNIFTFLNPFYWKMTC